MRQLIQWDFLCQTREIDFIISRASKNVQSAL